MESSWKAPSLRTDCSLLISLRIQRDKLESAYLLSLSTIVEEGKLHQYSAMEAQHQGLIFGRVPNALNGSILFQDSAAFLNSNRVTSDTPEREHAYSESVNFSVKDMAGKLTISSGAFCTDRTTVDQAAFAIFQGMHRISVILE